MFLFPLCLQSLAVKYRELLIINTAALGTSCHFNTRSTLCRRFFSPRQRLLFAAASDELRYAEFYAYVVFSGHTYCTKTTAGISSRPFVSLTAYAGLTSQHRLVSDSVPACCFFLNEHWVGITPTLLRDSTSSSDSLLSTDTDPS